MIRVANFDDLDKVYKICEQYNNNFKNLFFLEEELKNDFSILLLEEVNNNIISFLLAQDFGDNIDLLFIIVDNQYKNQGYATKLLKYFVDKYQVTNKTITLEVANNNKYAIKLYENFGFKTINTRKGYYNGVDGIVMRRE